MTTKIIIAMHKTYSIPKEDVYLPLQVGSHGKAPLIVDEKELARDDTGENISQKNPSFCELTGLYWAWKNLDADAIGLVHYRRHFTLAPKSARRGQTKELLSSVLTTAQAEELMELNDILVPKKRNYYIESLYSHYAHTLDGAHLDLARAIIHAHFPEMDQAVDAVYKRRWGYMFNMCIMRRPYLDAYCSWLFPILEEMEDALSDKTQNLSAFEARLYGRVSEILFNVWLLQEQKNQPNLRIREVDTMHMEPVNWLKKGTAFLKAKFFGKKYKASF